MLNAISRAWLRTIPERPTNQQAIGAAVRSEACAADPAKERRSSISSSLGASMPSCSQKEVSQISVVTPMIVMVLDLRELETWRDEVTGSNRDEFTEASRNSGPQLPRTEAELNQR